MAGVPEEYAYLTRWLSDPRVLAFYEGRDHPFTLEMVMQDFDPAANRAEGVIPCLLEYQKIPVGYLQFYPVEGEGRREYQFQEPGRTWALDLFIGEPQYWNRGLGTTFVRLLLDYLFHRRRADWVILDPHVDNARAIRAYEKCGFRKVKILPGHEWHEGQAVDCWLMAVRREDFDAFKS
jgi:aminoglycoside 6'-N-acetyltransferase